MIAIGKLVVLGVWVWGIAAFLVPESVPAAEYGRLSVMGLGAVHLIEALAFTKKLTAMGGSAANHFVQLLLFGFLHFAGVQKGAAAER